MQFFLSIKNLLRIQLISHFGSGSGTDVNYGFNRCVSIKIVFARLPMLCNRSIFLTSFHLHNIFCNLIPIKVFFSSSDIGHFFVAVFLFHFAASVSFSSSFFSQHLIECSLSGWSFSFYQKKNLQRKTATVFLCAERKVVSGISFLYVNPRQQPHIGCYYKSTVVIIVFN